MMIADVAAPAASFSAGPPRVLYEGPSGLVSQDGQRFLALLPVTTPQPPTQIRLVLGWFAELKQLAASRP